MGKGLIQRFLRGKGMKDTTDCTVCANVQHLSEVSWRRGAKLVPVPK